MGVVRIRIEVLASRGKRRSERIEALVDTGATLPVLPGKVLKSLGIRPTERIKLTIGDGRRIVRETGNARMRVEGREVWSRVVFGRGRDPAVVGLTVLEQLGLTVDARRRRLVPTEILLLCWWHNTRHSQISAITSVLPPLLPMAGVTRVWGHNTHI